MSVSTEFDVSVQQDHVNNSEGDAIKVIVRIRPSDIGDHDSCLDVNEDGRAVLMKCKPEPKTFTYDQVANVDSTQESIFNSVGKSIIDSCINGYNGTVFAYGQTGSGKTFTMLGPSEDTDNFQYEERGIIPRSFEYLFNLIEKEQEDPTNRVDYLCKCSFLEIYNEQIYDLLDASSNGLQLRENIKRGVFVDGLIEQVVNNASQAYEVLMSGWINRRVASTSMNRESSRSHAVFTVSVESKTVKDGLEKVKMCQLNLVDLAGSERQKDTHAEGMRLKEAGKINKSLSALGNVIMALGDIAHGKTRHVPYRDSKLSFLLRDSLGGNAKTFMVACVHPGSKCFGETLSTLRFARRAKLIKNKAVVNENTQGNISQLQAEIRKLKEVILQFRCGATPSSGPSLKISPRSSNQQIVDNEETNLWRNNFIHAMMLREKADQEKRDIQDKLQRLQDLCNKLEKSNQSKQMILKFRENSIVKLKRELSDKENTTESNDKNSILGNLEKEIKELNLQISHNPLLSKYANENQNLRTELKRWKNQSNNSDNANMQELERIFNNLMKEKHITTEENPCNRRLSLGPTSETEGKLTVAAIEKLKSQISQLQSDLDTARQEHNEKQEVNSTRLLELEAELASYKKSSEDYKAILHGHQTRSKIDRESMGIMHLETIKTMTTPTKKKPKYCLRNRLVLTSTDSPDIISEEMEEESIMSEPQPDQLLHEKIDALTDDIQKYQEQTNSLNTQIDDITNTNISLKQSLSKFEHQTQALTEERSQFIKENAELRKEIQKLNSEILVNNEKSRVLKSESDDLKVMWKSFEVELSNTKKDGKHQLDLLHKEKASIETKLMSIELTASKLARELEEIIIDKENLQDRYEDALTTNNFMESKLKENEETISELHLTVDTLKTDSMMFKERVQKEKSLNTELMEKLKQGNEEQQQSVLKSLEESASLCLENDNLKAQCHTQMQKLSELDKSLAEAHSMNLKASKKSEEDKAAISGFLIDIRTLKVQLRDKEGEMHSILEDIETMQGQCTYYEIINDDQVKKNKELLNKIESLESTFADKEESFDQSVALLNHESNDAQNELQSTGALLTREQEDNSVLRKQCHNLKQQISEKEQAMTDVRQSYENKLEESRQNANLAGDEVQDKLQKTEQDKQKLEEQVKILGGQMDSMSKRYQIVIEELETEKDQLKVKLDLAADQSDIDMWENRCDQLEAEKEIDKKNFNKRLSEEADKMRLLTNELQKVQLENEQNILLSREEKEEKDKMSKERDESLAANNKLREENAVLVGHANHKQKIQYHLEIKEENNKLRKKMVELECENKRLKTKTRQLSASSLKENLEPLSAHNNVIV